MKRLAILVVLARVASADVPPPAAPVPTKVIPAPKPTITDEEDAPPKLSLPTEADRLAWTRPGFRLMLGLLYGELHGVRGAPSGRMIGAKLRAGLRLDSAWSLMTSFEYTLARRTDALNGLRFAGTLDPTWHITRELSLAFGFGFAGIVEGDTTRTDADPLPDTIESSYTFPDASHPIKSCSGIGAAGLVRGEYGLVLGPRAQVTFAAEAFGQWTGCVDDSGRVEPDTGAVIERHQWWPHIGATFTVGVMWR